MPDPPDDDADADADADVDADGDADTDTDPPPTSDAAPDADTDATDPAGDADRDGTIAHDLHDLLYRLYAEYDTEALYGYREFLELFPPLGSAVALDAWERARDAFDRRADRIRALPGGETLVTVAAHATREQAFTALDLLEKYDRAVSVLVLDVDETLRSAGRTDNEIPRETLYLLTALHELGVPIVICTGQTLENVKGFLIQGLGNAVVSSGTVSVVYETGTGVFTPGQGPRTKELLYEELPTTIRATFDTVRSRALSSAPPAVRSGCHLQGNEFNVTLKPNAQIGSTTADRVIEDALCYLLDLLETAVRTAVADLDDPAVGDDGDDGDDAAATVPTGRCARGFYAAADPEIRAVLEARAEGGTVPRPVTAPDAAVDDVATEPAADPERDPATVEAEAAVPIPTPLRAAFERIDVAYYEADAAEITSLDLDKAAGVERAFEVLGLERPFALAMGDSKSDLRVMEWLAATDAGIAAAPATGSRPVVAHAADRDGLVFDPDGGASMLRTVYAMHHLARLT